MKVKFGYATLLVKDYEEAYMFYNLNLGCRKQHDSTTQDGQRLLQIGFGNEGDTGIWLVEAKTPEDKDRVGHQTGRQPVLVFYTSSVEAVYERLLMNKVRIVKDPVETPDARYLHFLDLYGNEIIVVEKIK